MFSRQSLLWRLYGSYVLIILLCLLVIGGYASWELATYIKTRLHDDLEARTKMAAEVFLPLLSEGPSPAMQIKAQALGRATKTRITLITSDGLVLADSDEDPARMDNHSDRPEIRQALGGQVGSAERHSNTLKMDMLYVAFPFDGPNGRRYIARVAFPLTDVQARIRAIRLTLAIGGGLAAILVLGLGYIVMGRIIRPLREIEQQAQRVAQGDLKVKFWADRPAEIGHLAETMNIMVARLDEEMRGLIKQRNEREAILSSMVEGVIALDANERLLMANQAAREILNFPAEGLVGRPILELVRNTAFLAFARQLLAADAARETEVEWTGRQKRILRLNGAPLRDEAGQEIGCVIVLNDVTRLRALEKMRSEFVANVSHELKTPITTIKGYIETLREGAISDPQRAAQFLEVAGRHADRLNAILEDLLSLSRLEFDADAIALEPLDLRVVVVRCLSNLRPKAASKNIALVFAEPSEAIPVMGNSNLLEQALGNVLDNAIKFSPEGRMVKVSLTTEADHANIEVADEGIGIPATDLPHIFERFYRVDKGRSREMGGTGLGLAIVKHILLAHKGEVTANSELGKGSTFILRIPLASAA